MKSFRALTINMVRASFRNRVALIFTLGLAFLFMFIFGELFAGNNVTLNIDVVNRDTGWASTLYINDLKKYSVMDVKMTSEHQAIIDLKQGNANGVIVIPQNFTTSASGQGTATVQIQLPSGAQTGVGPALEDIVVQFTSEFYGHLPVHGVLPPVQRINVGQVTTIGTHLITSIDYFMPAMMAYIILQSGINFVAISLVDLRVRQVLRRLRATPLKGSTILAAEVTGGALTVLLQVAIVALVGILVFNAKTFGDWAVAAVPIVLGVAAFVGIGFMLTSAAKTSEAARGLATMIALPMMFLSGIFFPITALPNWLQIAVHIFPLTWLNDALHQVLNYGASLYDIRIDCLVLLGWAIVTFLIATLTFRWE